MSEQLVNYFTLRQKHLFNYLHELELQGNAIALHDFRIEMKKLRALLKFLRSIYDKEKLKKADRKIKAIFLEAGEIREYQQLLGHTCLKLLQTASAILVSNSAHACYCS